MKFRRLTNTDEPLLREMLYHALYVREGAVPFPKEIVQNPELALYIDGWGRKTDLGFAAVDQITGQSVGAVWSRLFSNENRGYGYVAEDCPELSIAVLPAYRNRGIGTELLTHIMVALREHYSAVSLSVSSDNPARRLYERLGFESIADHGTSLTMIKRLTA